MIRHVCMFEFLEEAEGRTRAENVAITKAMLEALPEKIEWIRASTVATSVSESIESATIIFATLPILVVYPFVQRYFVSGVTIGAVKG